MAQTNIAYLCNKTLMKSQQKAADPIPSILNILVWNALWMSEAMIFILLVFIFQPNKNDGFNLNLISGLNSAELHNANKFPFIALDIVIIIIVFIKQSHFKDFEKYEWLQKKNDFFPLC